MLDLRRVMMGLMEIGARVAVSRLTEASIRNIRDIEAHIVEQFSVQLAKGIYKEKIKKTIETWKDFGDNATIHRVHIWALSDEDLERVANESYLQGVMDGRK